MKLFFSFILKEAKHILRDKRTMLILFGMPIVLMLLFGFAITTDVRNVRTVVVTSSIDYQTQQAIERLNTSEYFVIVATVPTPQGAERLIRNQKADMAIIFGTDYAKSVCFRLYHEHHQPVFRNCYDHHGGCHQKPRHSDLWFHRRFGRFLWSTAIPRPSATLRDGCCSYHWTCCSWSVDSITEPKIRRAQLCSSH